MKRIAWIIAAILGLVAIYVVGVLIRGSMTDWQPEGISIVQGDQGRALKIPIEDSLLTFVSWNIGYGGLGAEADFFLDAGGFFLQGDHYVRMPEENVNRYTTGILDQLSNTKADFFLLQEVDSSSARSYHDAQLKKVRATKPEYFAAFTPNYINERVPIPILQPWDVYGDVYSGLASLSKYAPSTAERHTLPGEFPWPDKLFQLDRCLLVERFPLSEGKTLSVINLHLSAYDDGTVKQAQLGYLAEFLLAEHKAGHLVVVGGDWNLVPPNFPYDKYIGDPNKDFVQQSVPVDFPGPGWTFVYDGMVPTNRKTNAPYIRDSTFVTTIDYFLLSPGLRARKTRVIQQDFQWSDHQPVWVEVEVEVE